MINHSTKIKPMDVLPAIGAAIPGLEDADNLLLGGFEDDDGLPSGSRVSCSEILP